MDRKLACQESERLLRKLGQAVKDLIKARQSGSARAAGTPLDNAELSSVDQVKRSRRLHKK